MYRYELGGPAFHLYLHLTQRNLSEEESTRVGVYMTLCAQMGERFVRTSLGGNFPKEVVLELYLTICGVTKMRSLNRQYRHRNRPTDVLSFPLHENLKVKGCEGLPRFCLGDIYICREVAFAQSTKFQISYYEELCHLFVHGFLHLLGYDHEISKRAEREMLQCEDDLLNNIMGSVQWKNLLK